MNNVMSARSLTVKCVRVRPVLVPLKRPVVSKVGQFIDWPLILVDLFTNEGIVGHSYLEPYLKQSVRYIIPAIQDLAEAARGQQVAPSMPIDGQSAHFISLAEKAFP
jgi:mandelate racemase